MRYRIVAFAISVSGLLAACTLPASLPFLRPTPVPTPSPAATETTVLVEPSPWVHLTHVGDIHALATQGDYLWAATDGGVIRWDTLEGTYVKYTRSDGLHRNTVTDIAIDGEGNIWFGTEDPGESTYILYGLPAVSKFDGRNWATYGTLRDAVEVEYDAIRTTVNENDLWLVDGEGRVWITFSLGVQAFDGAGWTIYEPPDTLVEQEATALAMDASGRIWIASRFAYGQTGGVSVFDGQGWKQYRIDDGLASSFVSDIAADEGGNVWFATDSGISRFDGERWTSYGMTDGLAGDIVHRMAVDPQGQAWIVADGGVSVFDGQSWRRLGVADGLSNELVHAIAFDSLGKAWFGTWGGAIDSFDGEEWARYVIEDELPDYSVNAITVDMQGRVWLGTSGPDPVVFERENWQVYEAGEAPSVGVIYAMASDANGNIWFHTSQGVNRLSPEGSWTTYETLQQAVEENYEAVSSTVGHTRMWVKEGAGGVWVGANRYDGQSWISYKEQEVLSEAEVTAVAIDGQGRIWFGTRDRGAVVLDGEAWSSHDQENSLLTDNWVKDILIDDEDRVWIATPEGLNVLTGRWWQIFTSEDGLINNNVLTMAVDKEGHVWLGTKGGVSHFDGESWDNYGILDVEDIAVDNEGNVWIGTLFDGLLLYMAEAG
jgi:ligand-binding sensor domain-containing protein